MDSNISELVKLGHERADELKSSCGAVDVRTVAQLISDLASQLEVQYVRSNALAAELKQSKIDADCYRKGMEASNARLVQLAAENAGLKAKGHELLTEACSIYEKFNATVNPEHGDFIDGQTLHEFQFLLDVETPATSAFLAEVRACAIPEGYAIVPQQIFLDPSDIESICSQCGDGHESGYGDFTDGLLWVGNIQRDDGSIVHGLHISSADYSEEGGVTVCEFDDQLRKESAQ